jgi:hyperosmotically inducible protein
MRVMAMLVMVGVMAGAVSACESTTGKTMGQNVSDASISTAVQTKLTGDRVSNFTRVDVDTERGVVQLSGVVPSSEQKSRAEELTRQVNGVRRVNNNLQVQAMHDSDRSTVK